MTGNREVVFYGPIGEAVKAVAPFTETDPIGIYAAALSMWSMAVSDRVFLDESKKRSPLVSTVLVAGTGVGKNVALHASRHIMNESVGLELMMRETSGITSGAALVDHLHEQMEITQEASGVPDTRALIIEQEWKETLETVARDRSYGPKIRQAWDCETLRNNTTRKGPNHQPKVVPNPRVVFHTHITPEDWQTMVSLKEAAGGSYNRFLPVALSDVPLLRRRTVPLVNTGDLVRAYKWVREADRVMTFTSAADHIYWVMRRAEKVLIKSLPKNQSVYVSRSAEQTWRVAALLACSEGSSRIAVGHMEAAASFVKYSIDTVLNLTKELSGTGRPRSKPEERVLVELMRHPGGVPSSRLQQVTGATADDLEYMTGRGLIFLETVRGKPGRPKMLYRLNNAEGRANASMGVAGMPVTDVPKKRRNPFLALLGR